MIIMKKEIKTAAGIVTIAAFQVDPPFSSPGVEYVASLEINGRRCTCSRIIYPLAMTTEAYSYVEQDLLDSLAAELLKEIK